MWREARWEKLDQTSSRYDQDAPAVYELAISRVHDSKIFVVYVGETEHLRQRHASYRSSGSHLKALMAGARDSNYTIWRRVKYLDDPSAAVRWQNRCLSLWDYAWNQGTEGKPDHNGAKRNVTLYEQNMCCIRREKFHSSI